MKSAPLKSENDYASLFINIKEPQHLGGQIVSGQVEILVKERLALNNLDLVLKGKEQTYWVRIYHANKHRRFRHFHGKKELIKSRIPLVSYSGKVLEIGYYKIDFQFQLPNEIPGSFQFFAQYRSSAKVQYQVNAELSAVDTDKSLKFKRILTVGQKYFPQIELKEQSDERNIKSFCCFSKGVSRITAKLELPNFRVNQKARILLDIDNSTCDAKMTKVKLLLIQRVILTTQNGGTGSITNTVIEQEFPGIDKKSKTAEWRALDLDIEFQKHVNKQKNFGFNLDKTFGDLFLQQSSKTDLIDCSYFIEVIPEYDVLSQSNSVPPKVQVPLIIGAPQSQKVPKYYRAPEIFSKPYEGESHEYVAEPISVAFEPNKSLQYMEVDVNEPLLGTTK